MTDEDGLKPNYTSIALNVTYRSVGNPQDIYNGFVRGYYHIVDLVVDVILPDALPEGKNQVNTWLFYFVIYFKKYLLFNLEKQYFPTSKHAFGLIGGY